MNRREAEEVFAACEKALKELSFAEAAIGRVEEYEERKELLRSLGRALGAICMFRAAPRNQYPDLEPPVPKGLPDDRLDEQDAAWVDSLESIDVEAIDGALLAECAPSWRKVASVVGTALNLLPPHFQDAPIGFLVKRIAALVDAGLLEAEGDLSYARFSEVRRPE